MESREYLEEKIQEVAGKIKEQTGLILEGEITESYSGLYQEYKLSINGDPISFRILDQDGILTMLARITLLDRLLELDLIKGVK